MRTSGWLVVLCSLALFAPSPAHADKGRDLVRMIKRAGRSGNPLSFLRELRGLGDVSLNAGEIGSALAAAKVKGSLRQLLAGVVRLQVRGDQVRLLRKRSVQVSLPKGQLALGRKEVLRKDLDTLVAKSPKQAGSAADAFWADSTPTVRPPPRGPQRRGRRLHPSRRRAGSAPFEPGPLRLGRSLILGLGARLLA